MKVAVLGGAGAIGKSVTRTLMARNIPVTVVGRSQKRLRDAFPDFPVTCIAADLTTIEGCTTALNGADSAVYAIGLPYTKTSFAAYPVMMNTLVKAARQTNLRQLLLITNVYPYGKPHTERVAETHPRVPIAVKGRYRKEQEDLLIAAHDKDSLRTLSLRLPDFYGPDSELSLAHTVFEAAVKKTKVNILGPIDTPHEFVFTRDVGPVVADLLERPDLFGTAYNFAGPGVISFREFTELVFTEADAGTPQLRVAQGLLLRFLGLFNTLLREMVEMEYLLKTPVILEDAKLREALPNLKKTTYADGIRQTLAAIL